MARTGADPLNRAVPQGVPKGVHQRSPVCLCLLFCKLFPRPSLGVQGALVAGFLDPLPSRLPGTARELAGAGRYR